MSALAAAAIVAASFTLTPLDSGTKARLQAVSAASNGVIWASGLEGTYTRSVDGGQTWTAGVVPGAEALQFRDVHAVDRSTAYLLSSGPGDVSRIYKTTDGGETWQLQHTNPEPEGFYDCMDFWDASHGFVYGDSVDGRMSLLVTTDGSGWTAVEADRLPAPLPGEGGFAASGTCAQALGDADGFVGMGVGGARLLRTRDRGERWEVSRTPVPGDNDTSGLTSVAFLPSGEGVAAGGDISAPDAYVDNVAVTEDFGGSWWLVAGPTFPGAIYGIAFVPGAPTLTLVAVGPGGASYSTDNGGSWSSIADDDYWSLDFTPSGVGFLVGPDGRLSKLELSLSP